MTDIARKTEKKPIFARRSLASGKVCLFIDMKARGWSGPSIAAKATIDIACVDARALAASLIQQADDEDARVDKKAASDERSKKWRQREIAAGRMVSMSIMDLVR